MGPLEDVHVTLAHYTPRCSLFSLSLSLSISGSLSIFLLGTAFVTFDQMSRNLLEGLD